MTPAIGQIVLVPMDPSTNNGSDIAPAVITRVWSDTYLNVRVLTEGLDVPWRTSVTYTATFDDLDPGYLNAWMWPPSA